ncbi:MAG: hypothetical protein ACK5LY_08400 [Lachnospirales bacterium]
MENEVAEVKIHNKTLDLSSDLGVEHVFKISEEVNNKIEQLSNENSLNTNEKLYLFTAISLCDELIRERSGVLDLHKDFSETTKKAGLENKQFLDECKELRARNEEILNYNLKMEEELKNKTYITEALEKKFNSLSGKYVTLEEELKNKELEIENMLAKNNSSSNSENLELKNKIIELEKKIIEQDKYILELQVSIQNQEDTMLELMYEKETLADELASKEIVSKEDGYKLF